MFTFVTFHMFLIQNENRVCSICSSFKEVFRRIRIHYMVYMCGRILTLFMFCERHFSPPRSVFCFSPVPLHHCFLTHSAIVGVVNCVTDEVTHFRVYHFWPLSSFSLSAYEFKVYLNLFSRTPFKKIISVYRNDVPIRVS